MNLSERISQFFERHKKTIQTLFFGVVVALVLFVFFRYLMPLIYPFVVAYVIALILQPIINFLSKKARVPRKLSILVLVLAVISLVGFLLFKTGEKIYIELTVLASNIQSFLSEMSENSEMADEFINNLASKIPLFDTREILHTIWNDIDKILKEALGKVSTNLGTIIPQITKFAASIPKLFIDTIIIIVSAFYLSNDFKKVNGFFAAQLPEKARDFGKIIKREFASTTGKYIRAYSLIIFITFAELFVGFTILDIRYSFVLALLVSVVDILPVLGTGTILIPWSIYSLLTGDLFHGIGLLVLYLVITIVRQIMEPKIVGSYIGLYPLVTLMCMYAGLQLFGVFGLFLFPITIIILKNLNDSGVIELWKNPNEDEKIEETSPKKKQKWFSKRKTEETSDKKED